MINGAHVIVFSSDPDADRAFFKEVFGLVSVDAGGGWLIFALPPAELAVHPAEAGKPGHELYLLCDDLDASVAELEGKGVPVERPYFDQPWGRLAFMKLPGGSRLGIYQARHPHPQARHPHPQARHPHPQAQHPHPQARHPRPVDAPK